MTSAAPILQVDGIHAHYGKSHVLQGASLHVNDGELVTLLGRNGAGKTTTLKCIAGAMRPTQGQIQFGGQITSKLATMRSMAARCSPRYTIHKLFDTCNGLPL